MVNNIQLAIETPTGLLNIPYTSENINIIKNSIRSQKIRSDRMVERSYTTNTETSCAYNFEFSANTFDHLLESALTSNEKLDNSYFSSVRVGNTFHKNNIHKQVENEYSIVFLNTSVNTLSLSISYGNIVNGGVTLVSEGYTDVNGGLQSVSNHVHTSPFVANNVGVIEIEGDSSGICVSDITLEINNNYTTSAPLGTTVKNIPQVGTFEVSGNITCYLSPSTYQLYLESLEHGKTFQLRWWLSGEDGVTYEFYLPNVDLNIPTPNKGGIDTDIMVDISYYGMYSPSLNNALIINKYNGASLIDIAANKLWPK